MNKIGFPRVDFDGISHDKDEFEHWYWDQIETRNLQRQLELIPIAGLSSEEVVLLRFIRFYFKKIVLASPETLEKLASTLFGRFSGVLLKKGTNGQIITTAFNDCILNALDYKTNRKTFLLELAKKINVKSCPYCNLHYTLYLEKNMKRSIKKLAQFQFDHFYAKKNYPFLSMSLYNLIPSCSICNQTKSASAMSIKYHPYHVDIHKLFKFRIADPLELAGGVLKVDKIEIKLVPTTPGDNIDDYRDEFKLDLQYSRHKDIAQEIYDKMYMEPYYSNDENFEFMCGDTSYSFRLLLGTYPDSCDIERRPLTKFIQDIWEQAHEEREKK